jgi:hypothetical protein
MAQSHSAMFLDLSTKYGFGFRIYDTSQFMNSFCRVLNSSLLYNEIRQIANALVSYFCHNPNSV